MRVEGASNIVPGSLVRTTTPGTITENAVVDGAIYEASPYMAGAPVAGVITDGAVTEGAVTPGAVTPTGPTTVFVNGKALPITPLIHRGPSPLRGGRGGTLVPRSAAPALAVGAALPSARARIRSGPPTARQPKGDHRTAHASAEPGHLRRSSS